MVSRSDVKVQDGPEGVIGRGTSVWRGAAHSFTAAARRSMRRCTKELSFISSALTSDSVVPSYSLRFLSQPQLQQLLHAAVASVAFMSSITSSNVVSSSPSSFVYFNNSGKPTAQSGATLVTRSTTSV